MGGFDKQMEGWERGVEGGRECREGEGAAAVKKMVIREPRQKNEGLLECTWRGGIDSN